MTDPDVTVVVPHYEDPHGLDLVLTALELQDHLGLEVVVADDGSRVPPVPGPRPYPVRVLRQADQGFRAAAARNLGASVGHGDVFCFLDADTVPEPGYVTAVLRAVERGADLVVGRRRHADLATTSPDVLRDWFRGRGPGPREFDEPAWLSDAYARTDDLRSAGDDAYRFVISAVLGVTRELFERVGGFEEGFTAYGGEDWEFAHRCWTAGADFVHARDAVAWHDGPDFAGRTDEAQARASRNLEGLTLARFVPDPAARGEGLVWSFPDVVVTLDDRDREPADVVLSVRSLLRGSDVGVWLSSGEAAELLDDPRVHRGLPSPDVLRRCRFRLDLAVPVELTGTTLRDLADAAPARVGPHLLVQRSRDLARGSSADVVDVSGVAGVGAAEVVAADLQRTWGHEEHRRPRTHTSLRTPSVRNDTPSSRP